MSKVTLSIVLSDEIDEIGAKCVTEYDISIDRDYNKPESGEPEVTTAEITAYTLIQLMGDNEMMKELIQFYCAGGDEDHDVSGFEEEQSTAE